MLKIITLFFTIGVLINLNLNAAVITTSICNDNGEIYCYTDAVITEKESFFSTLILDCNENSFPFCLGEAEGLVGEQLCIPLTARNYQNVAGFQFTMAFDTSIVIFDSVRQVPGGLTFTEDAINTDSASVGSIGFLYFSEDEAVYNQAEETTLLEFCFTGRAIGQSLAAFTNTPVEIFVSDANGDALTFSGGDGTLTVLACFDTETVLDTTICAGETVLIGGTIFTAAGTYTIPLISVGGCDSIVTLNLEIGEVGFTLPSMVDVCENEQATVTVPAGFLLGLNGNPQGTTILLAPAVYEITVFDESNACSNQQTVTVIGNPYPEITIEGSLEVCAGAMTTLVINGSDDYAYAWSNGSNEPINMLTPGEYTLTVTDTTTVAACEIIEFIVITELPLPEVNIEGALTYCAGSETELTASGANSYAWDTGATTASIVVTAPGQYCVTATDDNGCSAATCVTVEELPLPEVNIEGALSFCAGSETELSASGANSYAWDTGATTASIVVTAPGQYCVTATDDNGCSAATCVTVEELPLPEVSIDGALSFCAGSETELSASGATSYAWNTGATTATIVIAEPGEYCVTGTDANGCSSETCVTVMGDTENPVFAFCPTGASTIINFGETSGPVTWTAPLIEDNCGTNGITVESTHQPGDLFPIGETAVTYTATDAAGNSTNCIFTVSVTESAALTFFVDTLGYSISGDTFCVPIRVRNFTNVAAFQFTLEAPNTMLSTIEGIIPDPVFDSADPVGGVVYEAEDDNSGRILWLDASSDGITVPDSSIVFTVKMLITADFGECVSLDITDGLLDIEAFLIPDEAVRPTVYGGEVCVNNLIDITGEIYRIDDAPIRNAEVTLSTLDSIRLDTTDVPGRYAFLEAIGGEDYTLTPQRDFDDPEGLSVVDMIVILRHIQGRALIEDPYLLIAADVNQTMTLSVSDILEIRELILGNTQEFTNNTSWRFIPVDYVFPDPLNPWAEMFPESASLLGQDSSIAVDFYGIKIGDVNLTASGQLVGSGNLNLLVTNQAFMAGSIVEVPVYAESLEALSGLQLGLQFDSELLSLVEVLPGNVAGITPDASFSYSKITEGKLPFVYLRNELTAETSTAEQHLFTLRFAALQSGYLQDHLQLNHSVLLNLAVNEELEEWPVTLNWETPTNTAFLETDFSLLQVRPNPFQQEVFLDYHSSTTATAKVQIVDVRGVLVYEQEHLLETGEHSMLLALPLRLPTGVYHCRIKTPTNIFTTQIIKQ